MKKVLFVLALGAFAACGSGENKENATDTAAKVDTVAAAPVAPAADSTVKADSAAAPVAADTTKK